MFSLRVQTPDSTVDLPKESAKKRLKAIQTRSIILKLISSISGLIVVVSLLVATIIYAYKYTSIHKCVQEAQYNARIRELAKKINFTGSSLACDYKNVSVLGDMDMGYPPPFGNTDVVVMTADIRSKAGASEYRKKFSKDADAKAEDEPVRCDLVHDVASSKLQALPQAAQGGQCRCSCGRQTFNLSRSQLSIPLDMQATAQPQAAHPNAVTLYQIDNCTLDRHDEADSLVNTLTVLSALKGVAGIPALLDAFEDDNSIFVAVHPPLLHQLQHASFATDADLLLAITMAVGTMAAAHDRRVALMNASPKSMFVAPAAIYFEPPTQALLLDQDRMMRLGRGMVLPKVEPPLEAGGLYSVGIDYFLLFSAFESASGSVHVKEKLKSAKELCFEMNTKAQLLDAKTVERVYLDPPVQALLALFAPPSTKSKIDFKVGGFAKLAKYSPRKDGKKEKECSVPVYDYILSIFRSKQKEQEIFGNIL